MKKTQIINDINSYVGSDPHKDWYVGIATNVEERLFVEHCVDKKNDKWIHCKASSENIARETESELLGKYGYDGGTGGGTSPTYVYAYKKKLHTKE